MDVLFGRENMSAMALYDVVGSFMWDFARDGGVFFIWGIETPRSNELWYCQV
jgi:hypothetical protein